MLTTLSQNRSLTFYQQTSPVFRSELKPAHTGGIVSASIASSAHTTATTTNAFNTQLQGFLDKFNAARAADASTLNLTDPNSVARNRGVYRAWEYEKADVMMGGRGSANWNDQECQDIIDNVSFDSQSSSRSGVRGAEGHHQKNVADHPGEQANPDNIKFYKTREEHLEKGHGGDFHNESDAPMIDKNKMLEKTNSKRVYKNELRGLGVAVAIGLGVGFTIGVVTTLAQSGITPDSLKHAAAEGVKGGLESGVMSTVGYGIGRTIGQVASNALAGVLENVGVTITENVSKMINMGVVGALTVVVFSAYQFIKLKQQGMATKEALIQTGKQALFSLSLLAVSIAAQGLWGGPAGIIVSVSVGIILISYSVVDSVHQRHFAEKIRVYTISKCKPCFSV